MFVAILDFIVAQHALLEPLYAMEKAGKFNLQSPESAQARAFLAGQLRKGGEMLASLWLTAWRNAGPDVFLRTQLLKRKAGAGAD